MNPNTNPNVIPLPAKAPNAEGLETNEYRTDGLVLGNKDIEASSCSVEFPPLSDEELAAGNECEARR